MIAQLNEELKKSNEEKKKIQADAEKSTSRAAASAEEEKKAAHARADKMLALTQKYQQGCQSLIAQRTAEEERAREAQEKTLAKSQSEGAGSASSPLVVEEIKEVSDTGKRKHAETASASPMTGKAAILTPSPAQAAKDRPAKLQRVASIAVPSSDGESRPALIAGGSSYALAGAGPPPTSASSTISPRGQLGGNVAAAKKTLTTPPKAAPHALRLQPGAASAANTPGQVLTLTDQSDSQATPAASAGVAVVPIADKDSSTAGAAAEVVVSAVDMIVDLEQESGL